MNRLALITILSVVACSATKEEPDTDTTDTTNAGPTTSTATADTSTGPDSSPTSSSSTSPTNTTEADPTTTDTPVTDTSNTDTTDTDDPVTTTTDTDTMDPTAADPVCGPGPAPGETFMIDFGGEVGLQTYEQAGNTGCHYKSQEDTMLISLVWSSTTKAGFTISAALFSGDYASLGELVGNTLPYAPTNQLSSNLNAPGLGSYDAKGAGLGLHISSLTEKGITGCLVGFDAYVRKGDALELKPASPIAFACGG